MTNSLFEEFRAHTRDASRTLHADLTLYSLLSFLPEAAIIQIHTPEHASALQLAYSTPGGHGTFTLSQSSPELRIELKRWIDKRETKRALGQARELGQTTPPDDNL